MNSSAIDFFNDLGHKIVPYSGEDREGHFLSLQRYSAILPQSFAVVDDQKLSLLQIFRLISFLFNS